MATYKTPGVYIEEISVIPASVAGVGTAIPAFIGYVEKAENNGIGIPFNTPTRITSILEYETIFGKGESQTFTIGINDVTIPAPTLRNLIITKGTESVFKMYYNIQMYFLNGGGPCYIVPVGLYSSTLAKAPMIDGLTAIAKVDEPTLLLFPDAVSLSAAAERKDLYDQALAQCQKLKDRFTIMDVVHNGSNTVFQDADDFRSTGVGPDNLKYGAAYYPFLNTTLGLTLDENLLWIDTQKVDGSAVANSVTSITLLNNMEKAILKIQQGFSNAKIQVANLSNASILTFNSAILSAVNTFNGSITGSPAAFVTAIQTSTAAVAAYVAGAFDTANIDYEASKSQIDADALIASYNKLLSDILAVRTTAYATLNTNVSLSSLVVGSMANLKNSNPTTYNSIMAQLTPYTVKLNPSGAMAGIYARVDSERGVWKAPANVGVRSITGPSINVTNSEQDGLNVDATSGKSINVIRSFTGRGTLVWGARTLAGNDNEWRYINVRRLFTYVEESVQEATAFVVFEPNTANTWQRVIGMIEAFLTGLWRDGALAGATTKEAFSVRCGIGVTMTAQDILEGRMIVEVAMAAVRPAEFIILKFEHKLQES